MVSAAGITQSNQNPIQFRSKRSDLIVGSGSEIVSCYHYDQGIHSLVLFRMLHKVFVNRFKSEQSNESD